MKHCNADVFSRVLFKWSELARSQVWWPGLINAIESCVQGCEACQAQCNQFHYTLNLAIDMRTLGENPHWFCRTSGWYPLHGPSRQLFKMDWGRANAHHYRTQLLLTNSNTRQTCQWSFVCSRPGSFGTYVTGEMVLIGSKVPEFRDLSSMQGCQKLYFSSPSQYLWIYFF